MTNIVQPCKGYSLLQVQKYRAALFMSSSATLLLVRPGFNVLGLRFTFVVALGATQAMVSSAIPLPAHNVFSCLCVKNGV